MEQIQNKKTTEIIKQWKLPETNAFTIMTLFFVERNMYVHMYVLNF